MGRPAGREVPERSAASTGEPAPGIQRRLRPPSRDGRRGGGAAQPEPAGGAARRHPRRSRACPGPARRRSPPSLLGLDQDPAAVAAASRALAPYGTRARVERSRFDRHPRAARRPRRGRGCRRRCSTWGSALRSSTGPSGGSATGRTDRSTCAWTPPARSRRATWSMAGPKLISPGCFADNGETRFASRIARAVVAARPIETTLALAEVVRQAIPAAARRTGGHPARRVFQAVRVAVNEELDILPAAIDAALAALRPGRSVRGASPITRARIASPRSGSGWPSRAGACVLPGCHACAARSRGPPGDAGSPASERGGDRGQPAGRERPPPGG